MASLFAIAATLLAACPTAIGAGMGASVERFSTNYAADDGYKQDFWNLFAPANSADGRSDAMAPSSAAKVYSRVLDFDSRDYPEQTNIFRGVVNVDECAAGTYKLEMTTSRTAHIFVDGEMLTGIHQTGTPETKVATIEFKPGQDYSLEVAPPAPPVPRLPFHLDVGEIGVPVQGAELGAGCRILPGSRP